MRISYFEIELLSNFGTARKLVSDFEEEQVKSANKYLKLFETGSGYDENLDAFWE